MIGRICPDGFPAHQRVGIGGFLPIFSVCLLLQFSCEPTSETGDDVVNGACDSCRVDLVHVARLGDRPEGYLLGEQMVISKDSRGRWFVSSAFHPTFARVFDFDGEFLGDFGTEGEGPGEFKFVVEVHESPLGTLNHWDWGNNRFSRFSLDFDFISQFGPEISPHHRVFTTNGRLAVNAPRIDENGQVSSLHLLDEAGLLNSSFGTVDPPFEGGPTGRESLRSLSASTDGGIWAGALARYEIEHWDSAGHLTHVLRRDVDWFRPHSDPATREDPKGPAPNPKLRAIREDAAGRLWTLNHLPGEEWKDGFSPDTLGSGLIWMRPLDEMHYDSRIEVLDPESGMALAGITIPEYMDRFVTAPFGEVFLYSISFSPIGEPYVEIWRPELHMDEGGIPE